MRPGRHDRENEWTETKEDKTTHFTLLLLSSLLLITWSLGHRGGKARRAGSNLVTEGSFVSRSRVGHLVAGRRCAIAPGPSVSYRRTVTNPVTS